MQYQRNIQYNIQKTYKQREGKPHKQTYKHAYDECQDKYTRGRSDSDEVNYDVEVKVMVKVKIRGQGPTEANDEGQGRLQRWSPDPNAKRFFVTVYFLKTAKRIGN